MKKISLVIFSILIFSSVIVCGQQVVATAGAEFARGNVSLSWTLGEPICEILSNEMITLCQGFQQGFLKTNTVNNISFSDSRIQVFPNPTQNKFSLLVESDEFSNLRFFLHNVNGKEITSGPVKSDLTKIDLDNFSKGIYFLRLVDKSGQAVRSYKVIKQ